MIAPHEAISYLAQSLDCQEVPAFALNGRIVRFGPEKVCWAVGHDFGDTQYIVAGRWNTDTQVNWSSKQNEPLTTETQKEIRKRHKAAMKAAEEERKKEHAKHIVEIKKRWNAAAIGESHEYLKRKKVPSIFNAKIQGDMLLIPVSDFAGDIKGLQAINSNGNKKFVKGSDIKNGICALGCPVSDLFKKDELWVAEGYATACTIHILTRKPVLCCFTAGNIAGVVKKVKENFKAKVIIAADNDNFTFIRGVKKNIGVEKAAAAAKEYSCEMRVPRFRDKRTKPTDFNDLLCLEGPEICKKQLAERDYIVTQGCGFTTFTISSNGNQKMVRHHDDLQRFYDKKTKYKNLGELRRVMLWNGKYYEKTNDTAIKCFAQNNYRPELTKEAEAVEFMHHVKRYNYVSTDFLNNDVSGKVNFQNGVYDFDRGTFEPHNSDYCFQYVLDYDYNPSADNCDTWLKFLWNITYNRADLIVLLEQFLAFIISGMSYTELQNVLILSGSGINGKSSFIKFVENFIGTKNAVSVPIESIVKDQFALAQLEGKLVNFCEEENPQCFRNTGPLKKITGGTPVHARHPYENGFEFTNIAKMIITYNEIPHLADTSKGMLRRLLIVPFDLDLEKEPDKKIIDLQGKLLEERSAIFNRCINSYRELKENGFNKSKTVNAERVGIAKDSDAFLEWFDDYVSVTSDPHDKITTHAAYHAYTAIMEHGKSDIMRLSERGFIKKMRLRAKAGRDFEYKVIKSGNSTSRGFAGIKIQSDNNVYF